MQIYVSFSRFQFQNLCAIQSSMFLKSSLNLFLFSYLIALTKFLRFNWKINLFFSFLLPVLFIALISWRSPSWNFHHLPQTELLSWIVTHLSSWFRKSLLSWLGSSFLDHFLLSCVMPSFCWHMSCNFLITTVISSRLFLSESVSLSVWNEEMICNHVTMRVGTTRNSASDFWSCSVGTLPIWSRKNLSPASWWSLDFLFLCSECPTLSFRACQ